MSTINLPRNVRARNINSHHKKNQTQNVTQSKKNLLNICEKHKIGNITFRSCKFASEEGKTTHVEYGDIKGNMRASIIIVTVTNMVQSDDIYDIVSIHKNKIERDEKRKQEEMEKIKLERENMVQLETKNDDEMDDHNKLLDQLNTEINQNDTPETFDQETKIDPNCTNTFQETKSEPTGRTIKNKRNKAVKQLQNEIPKNSSKEGNRFYRNFIRDIKSKFTLVENKEFCFFEVKSISAEMIITNAKVYQINISNQPTNTKEIYLLVKGDLQMKYDVISRIDPSYKNNNTLRDQDDFLERIRNQDKLVTVESSEKNIDEETSI